MQPAQPEGDRDADYVVGGLFVVHVVIDGKIAEFVNMHIRPLQAAEEGR